MSLSETAFKFFEWLSPGSRSWLTEPAIGRTLGEDAVLPEPTVSEPTADQKEGRCLPHFPSYIALEVTNVCNIKCTHCNYRYGVAHYTRDRGYMSLETAKIVLEDAQRNEAAVLMNYDGEPLMNKKFMEFLRIAQDLSINSYFNTNGTLFNKAFADELVSFYKGAVFFSVDGDQEWFNKVRLGADYDKVVANLEYFIAANDAAGWPISIGVSFCNLGQTVDARKAFIDRWLHKVNFVSLGETNDKDGKRISEPMTVLKPKRRPVCIVPWQTLGICHNGDVVPCSIYITRANTANAIFGNIHENTLQEIWKSERVQDFRKMLASGTYQGTFCQNCERWLCQFTWERVTQGDVMIERNGYWTSYYNLKRGIPAMRGG